MTTPWPCPVQQMAMRICAAACSSVMKCGGGEVMPEILASHVRLHHCALVQPRWLAVCRRYTAV